MRYKLTLFFAFAICWGLHSKDYYLDFKDAYLDSWAWGFAVDSIIDAREDKALIGFAYKGFPKRKRLAYLKKPLADELMPIFNKAEKSLPINKGIILRINHLYVYETRHDGKYGFAEANVSFIEKRNGQYVELFQASGYFSDEGISMAKWHPQNIVDVLASCFSDFEMRSSQGKLRPRDISGNQLADNPYVNQRPYPIETADRQSRVLYRSFYDFRDNFPDTTTRFFPEYFEKKDELAYATIGFRDDGLDLREVYAFCDEQRLFVRGGKKFYEIADSNSNFYLDRHAISYDGYASGMITSGILFGPVGVALYALASTPTANKDGYFLDLDLGRVLPTDIEEIKSVNAKITIYNSDFNDSTQSIEIFINDQLVCSVPPGGYYLFEPPVKSKPATICISFQDQEVCSEVSGQAFVRNLYLVRFNRKEELKFKLVTTDLEDRIYQLIKYGTIQNVCN